MLKFKFKVEEIQHQQLGVEMWQLIIHYFRPIIKLIIQMQEMHKIAIRMINLNKILGVKIRIKLLNQ